MYVTAKTDSRFFGYEMYFTSPKLTTQFKAAKLKYDYVEVDKFQRSIEALYTLIICEMISDELADKIKNELSSKINEHICELN